MDSDIQDALNEYYKLKKMHEEKYTRQKRRILKNPSVSKKEKRLKLKQIKKTCIHCKQKGGTIFGEEGRMITATCGAATPCKLNITIQLGDYENIRTRKLKLFKEIQAIHSDIIKTKLNLLFNYTNEADAVSEFESHREDFDIISKNYVDESRKYSEITHPEGSSIKLKEYENSLFIEKEKLRELNKLHSRDPEQKYINEMVELYITKIRPIAQKIREDTYVYSAVEKASNITTGDPTYNLVELPYTLSQLYTPETNDSVAKILSNDK